MPGNQPLPPTSGIVTDTVWLDLNTGINFNGKPDLLPNERAILNSLFNLFQCPVGARGPIAEPEYGSQIYSLLHEPINLVSANRIRAVAVQAIQRWEPRIQLDIAGTTVIPDYSSNSFHMVVAFTVIATKQNVNYTFVLTRS